MQNMEQFAYNDWLVEACGPDVAPLPAWRKAMYQATGAGKRARPDDYRCGHGTGRLHTCMPWRAGALNAWGVLASSGTTGPASLRPGLRGPLLCTCALCSVYRHRCLHAYICAYIPNQFSCRDRSVGESPLSTLPRLCRDALERSMEGEEWAAAMREDLQQQARRLVGSAAASRSPAPA